MTDCVIFDIDGTLADLSHRLHHITGKSRNYEAFFDALKDDAPRSAIIRLAQVLNEHETVLVSGRPSDRIQATEQWLKWHRVPYDALYMRKAGDHRADHIVKREILDQLRADGWEPWLVIDDRPTVVAMWRAAGIECLQTAYQEAPLTHLEGKELLTIMVGPTGGGKSTLAAARWSARTIISSDDVREDMLGDRFDQTANQRVFKAVHALASERLRHGLPVVIDATNLRRKDRMACANLVPDGVRARYVVVDRPMDAKLRDRGWRWPELLEKHAQTFRSQLAEILAGDHLVHVTVEDCRVS